MANTFNLTRWNEWVESELMRVALNIPFAPLPPPPPTPLPSPNVRGPRARRTGVRDGHIKTFRVEGEQYESERLYSVPTHQPLEVKF